MEIIMETVAEKVKENIREKRKNDILEFNFTPETMKEIFPIKEITKDRYRSKKILNPKNEADKRKYFKIYEEYVLDNLLEKQLADKYSLTVFHVSRIIKWATFEIGEIDKDAQLRVIVDKTRSRLQEMAKVYKTANTVNEKVQIWREMNRCDVTLSRIEGLINNTIIDMSDKRQVTVTMNEEFERRVDDKKQIEMHDVKLEGNNIKQIEHRTEEPDG